MPNSTTYRNVGKSVWRRPTNEVVPPNGTFEATPEEHRRITRRTYLHKRLVLLSEEEVTARAVRVQQAKGTAPAAIADVAADVSAVTLLADAPVAAEETAVAPPQAPAPPALDWPLKMTPERYVMLHKTGQHAPLARRILREQKKQEKEKKQQAKEE